MEVGADEEGGRGRGRKKRGRKGRAGQGEGEKWKEEGQGKEGEGGRQGTSPRKPSTSQRTRTRLGQVFGGVKTLVPLAPDFAPKKYLESIWNGKYLESVGPGTVLLLCDLGQLSYLSEFTLNSETGTVSSTL